jgi:hypothetical protein
MSVGFYITFIGLLTRRYIEQTPYMPQCRKLEKINHISLVHPQEKVEHKYCLASTDNNEMKL